ncbi:hypothetical protein BG003_002904 [Podila horticola]|nr:hypothetical protein BG003_002904 [Podila horticola]
MTELTFLMTADASRPLFDQYRIQLSWTMSLGYIAFSVETVFTENGPSVTRGGFLTYLRSEMSGNPDEAFADYTRVNQALRFAPPIVRSQLPQFPDRQMKDITERFKKYTEKTLQEFAISGARQSNFGSEMERLKVQQQKNVLSDMRVKMAQNQRARMEQSVELSGRLGSNVCSGCGRYSCFC